MHFFNHSGPARKTSLDFLPRTTRNICCIGVDHRLWSFCNNSALICITEKWITVYRTARTPIYTYIYIGFQIKDAGFFLYLVTIIKNNLNHRHYRKMASCFGKPCICCSCSIHISHTSLVSLLFSPMMVRPIQGHVPWKMQAPIPRSL